MVWFVCAASDEHVTIWPRERRSDSEKATSRMANAPNNWHDQQAIERLAQHIPFETDPRTKAECIEMLREVVLRAGRSIDRELFGFEARQELQRLGLWDRLGNAPA
jgi:hypothetical protein